jgi:hypothetical protein
MQTGLSKKTAPFAFNGQGEYPYSAFSNQRMEQYHIRLAHLHNGKTTHKHHLLTGLDSPGIT